jgi:DHA2 family methylenomycin A resistance protein-like MFS transporter
VTFWSPVKRIPSDAEQPRFHPSAPGSARRMPPRPTSETTERRTGERLRPRAGGAPAGGEPRPAPSRWVVLGVMCVGYFLVLLDVTIVNVALPSIGSGLGASVSGLQWVVDGYAIALATLMLAGGTVGDLHGHKRVVLAGLAAFGAASLGCGLAPSIGLLVAFRIAQGVGAALLLPGTLAVVTHAFPERREQARAIGVWAGIGSVALPAGPLLGGALVQGVGWRAVFFINAPIVIAAFAVVMRVVRESADPGGRRLDAGGVALGALTLAAVTFAFIQAGHAGVSVTVAVAAIVALSALGAFVVVERSRPDPVLPLALFGRRDFATANVAASVMNLGTLGLLFVLMLYLQQVQHRSALEAGLAVIPLFAPLSLLAPVAGRLTARVGSKLPMAAGLLIAAIGVALLARLQADASFLTLLPGLLAWGIGLGVLTPAVVAAAVRAVPGERAGLGSAVNNTARQTGGAIGIAAYGALAGRPGSPGFLGGLHAVALITAALFLAGVVASLAAIPARGE